MMSLRFVLLSTVAVINSVQLSMAALHLASRKQHLPSGNTSDDPLIRSPRDRHWNGYFDRSKFVSGYLTGSRRFYFPLVKYAEEVANISEDTNLCQYLTDAEQIISDVPRSYYLPEGAQQLRVYFMCQYKCCGMYCCPTVLLCTFAFVCLLSCLCCVGCTLHRLRRQTSSSAEKLRMSASVSEIHLRRREIARRQQAVNRQCRDVRRMMSEHESLGLIDVQV